MLSRSSILYYLTIYLLKLWDLWASFWEKKFFVHVTTTTQHSDGDWCDVIDTSVHLVPYRTSPKDGRFGTKTCNLCSFLGVFSDCNIFNSISWITFQKLRSDRSALRLSISEASKYFFRERRQAVQRNCGEAEYFKTCLSL